jgi:purine-binding chemotaxis protein CheW
VSPEPASGLDVDEILERRARALAEAPSGSKAEATLAVLLVRLGGEQYALDMGAMHSVQRAVGLTPIPNTPGFVAGILNVRGDVVAVLDLAVALGSGSGSGAAPAATAQVVLVDAPRGRVGLLVDEVLRVASVAPGALDRSFSGRDFARGIADGRFVLLDLGRLLSDERFSVLEEVA